MDVNIPIGRYAELLKKEEQLRILKAAIEKCVFYSDFDVFKKVLEGALADDVKN
jgi:hypothetical protein